MQIENTSPRSPSIQEVALSIQRSKEVSNTDEAKGDTVKLSLTGKSLAEIHDIELVKTRLENVNESEERIEKVQERIKNRHYDQLEFLDQLANVLTDIV